MNPRVRVTFRTCLAECQLRGIHWLATNSHILYGELMTLRFRRFALSLVIPPLFGGACSKAPAQRDSAAARPTIVFMTDFGTANDAVAICKAVMVSIAPDARIMDITHAVTPYQIEEGARF